MSITGKLLKLLQFLYIENLLPNFIITHNFFRINYQIFCLTLNKTWMYLKTFFKYSYMYKKKLKIIFGKPTNVLKGHA